MFSYEFWEIFKSSFVTAEHLWTTVLYFQLNIELN